MRSKKENGQIIVMVAASIIALVIFSGLVIDGGMMFLVRREMQTAADSAAIAAASVYCQAKNPNNNTINTAIDTGIEYAVTNGADEVNVYQETGSRFYASATKNLTTFFAGFIGFEEVNIFAEAAAICGPAKIGINLLPISYACRDAVGLLVSEDPEYDPGEDVYCQGNSMTKTELNGYIDLYGAGVLDSVPESDPNYTPLLNKLYVIMDVVDFDNENCEIPEDPLSGYFNCDLDGDGLNDLIASEDRGWMDLNGGQPDANDLADWIENGFMDPLSNHTWFPSDIGNMAGTYGLAEPLEGTIVLIPVFDIFCPDDDCVELEWHVGVDDIKDNVGNDGLYFHVITFVEFYVTCVDPPGSDDCPGSAVYRELAGINGTLPVIEGYILTGYSDNIGGDPNSSGTSAGAYSIYLVPTE